MHQTLDAGEQIASRRAFVATVTTRLAINELRSARARRERYVGEWLPEPIITDVHDDPARHAETADSLSLAMLVLLESLSPEQRAALLLHDVFDYGYPEIATIVGKSEDNVRQLATRARRHVEQRRPRFQTTREQHDELTRRFFAAPEQGDLAGLEALLAHDVVLTGDGGGKAPALAQSLRGRDRVARGDQLVRPGRAPSGGVVASHRGQRRPGSALSRRTVAADRRVGARHRRRSDHKHQLDRQPRQADAPRACRRRQIATEVGEMNSGAFAATPVQMFGAALLAALVFSCGRITSPTTGTTRSQPPGPVPADPIPGRHQQRRACDARPFRYGVQRRQRQLRRRTTLCRCCSFQGDRHGACRSMVVAPMAAPG
ncbi:MAG: sigma factor-like helix-turn-helix DNA-binding protein [Chloroflexota bacterium]